MLVLHSRRGTPHSETNAFETFMFIIRYVKFIVCYSFLTNGIYDFSRHQFFVVDDSFPHTYIQKDLT